MDIWLCNGVSPRGDKDHVQLVKKCRDELEQRLKEKPAPKVIKN